MSAAIPDVSHIERILAVLACPVPISMLVPRTGKYRSQPHAALVLVFHVEDPVPSCIAASRYVHFAFRSSPHVNGVVATWNTMPPPGPMSLT